MQAINSPPFYPDTKECKPENSEIRLCSQYCQIMMKRCYCETRNYGQQFISHFLLLIKDCINKSLPKMYLHPRPSQQSYYVVVKNVEINHHETVTCHSYRIFNMFNLHEHFSFYCICQAVFLRPLVLV